MRFSRIDPLNDKAEGDCKGLPYTTEITSSEGATAHFWLGEELDLNALREAAHRLSEERDIIGVTYSLGRPTGYWAYSHVE